MVPNHWYAVIESKTIRTKPVSLKRLGMDLVAWRDTDGTAVVMPARCPHRGANLALGRVQAGTLECPCLMEC